MQKMFDKYQQTFDYFFYLIYQGVKEINSLSKSQKMKAISTFLDEVDEEDLPSWEIYLPTFRLLVKALMNPKKYMNFLKFQGNFIESIWETYGHIFKEIFEEATILNKCPLPHKLKKDTLWEDYVGCHFNGYEDGYNSNFTFSEV
jgi:hypothetical protein